MQVTENSPQLNDPIASLVTIFDWTRYIETQLNRHRVFFGHGYQKSVDEAALLVCGALRLAPERLAEYQQCSLTIGERQQLLALLEQRCVLRRPLAYVTGESWFCGQRFLCDERALVPRSLIAELVLNQFEPWLPDDFQINNALDLCTGGASLAILLKQTYPLAHVWASDISPEALALARENLELHHLSPPRIRLLESDLFSGFDVIQNQPKFDLIICNPPYVNAESMGSLPKEYSHEPQGALAAGHDGMDLIKKILRQATQYLNENGFIVLEIGHEANYFEAAFTTLEFAYLPVDAGDAMVVLVAKSALQAAKL
jgi:ribosomal protein L3 glutamine methyltransferase